MSKRKSFFERLTGGLSLKETEENENEEEIPVRSKKKLFSFSKSELTDEKEKDSSNESSSINEDEDEGQLTVDLYQTPTDIVVQTMISGVQPDNLSVVITRDMITIKGKREENRSINKENYFIKELFWGSFSRTISLPEEIDPEEATALEKHGLLIIKLPKINKDKQTNLKVKSV